MDNSAILVISCTHLPHHHIDTIPFLKHIISTYNITRMIHLGDEIDSHAMSFHDSDPNLDSPGTEYEKSLGYMHEFYDTTRNMQVDVMHSNHGSMVYRRAKTHGIPNQMIKSYEEIWEAPSNWKWHQDLLITLPGGEKLYSTHQKSANSLAASKAVACNIAVGHNHSKFDIQYYFTGARNFWGMHVGCLADRSSLAMAYGRDSVQLPVLGASVILSAVPYLLPMRLDNNGRWIKRL